MHSHMKTSRVIALALLSLGVSACEAKVDERLQPFALAELQPGRGIGDAVLGETTLAEFSRKYGTGTVAMITTDETTGFELIFASGQLKFLFPVELQFARDQLSKLRIAVLDLSAWIPQFPEIADALLTSVSVKSADGFGDDFYQGQVTGGVRLGDSIQPAVAKLGDLAGDDFLPTVAGMSPRNPGNRIVDLERGIALFYDDDPATIVRITIFEPEE